MPVSHSTAPSSNPSSAYSRSPSPLWMRTRSAASVSISAQSTSAASDRPCRCRHTPPRVSAKANGRAEQHHPQERFRLSLLREQHLQRHPMARRRKPPLRLARPCSYCTPSISPSTSSLPSSSCKAETCSPLPVSVSRPPHVSSTTAVSSKRSTSLTPVRTAFLRFSITSPQGSAALSALSLCAPPSPAVRVCAAIADYAGFSFCHSRRMLSRFASHKSTCVQSHSTVSAT